MFLENLSPFLVAGTAGFFSAFLFTLTKKFSRTFPFVATDYHLWLYFLLFAGISMAFYGLIHFNVINFQIVSLDNNHLKAILIGAFSSTLATTPFTKNIGGQSKTISISSLTWNLDVWLLDSVVARQKMKIEKVIMENFAGATLLSITELINVVKVEHPYLHAKELAELEVSTSTKNLLITYFNSYGKARFQSTFSIYQTAVIGVTT